MHKNCSYFQFSPKIGISYVQFSSYPIVQFSSPCNVNKVKLWNMQSLPINYFNYESSFRKYERLDFEHLICAVCPWWVILYFSGSFYFNLQLLSGQRVEDTDSIVNSLMRSTRAVTGDYWNNWNNDHQCGHYMCFLDSAWSWFIKIMMTRMTMMSVLKFGSCVCPSYPCVCLSKSPPPKDYRLQN